MFHKLDVEARDKRNKRKRENLEKALEKQKIDDSN
jgi:hypothetical protein